MSERMGRFYHLRNIRNFLSRIEPEHRDSFMDEIEAAHEAGGDLNDLRYILSEDRGEYRGSWDAPH